MKPDLVLIAVPRASSQEPVDQDAWIRSQYWLVNYSLSFGKKEWDAVVVHPSVWEEGEGDRKRERLKRDLVFAHDLSLVNRSAGDERDPEAILLEWLLLQKAISSVAGDSAESRAKFLREMGAKTEEFLQDLAAGRTEAARKHLYQVSDDPELQSAEGLAANLESDFSRFGQFMGLPKRDPKFQKVRAMDVFPIRGRMVVKAEFWGFEPGNEELEPGDIAWIFTQNSGWRIIEM